MSKALRQHWLCIILSAWMCLPLDGSVPPNILFIMSDDHAAAAWGIYPSRLQPYVQAPHLQRLAAEGCRLDRAYATNALCGPSRASILTGLYSHANGVRTNADGLDPSLETLPLWLGHAGYATAIFGKWHLKSKPSWFDTYKVLEGQGDYQDPVLRDPDSWQSGHSHAGFSADVITTEALNWLEAHDSSRPFFLMCHFKAPHEPFGYPERYANWLDGADFPLPETIDSVGPRQGGRTFAGQTLDILAQRFEQHPQRYQLKAFEGSGPPAMVRRLAYQELVRNFLRSVRAVDDNIGRLLDHLDHSGQLDNTLIIYTTDQGYFLGEHGFFDKRIMYEEAIRMPMVIRFPAEIEAGSVNRDLVLNVDLPLLFLDYAGVPAPAGRHGRSFRQNLQGATPADWRTAIYYRYWAHEVTRPAHFGIRTDRFKLIHFYGQPLGMEGADLQATPPTWELYDLEQDPLEENNLCNDPRFTQSMDTLRAQLLRLQIEVGDTLPCTMQTDP
jgi:arylsulfatase A-like enzyme